MPISLSRGEREFPTDTAIVVLSKVAVHGGTAKLYGRHL